MTAHYWCLTCPATDSGTDTAVQKAAEAHTKAAGHGTTTSTRARPDGWGERGRR